MKAFAIYTALRLGVFVACYAVIGVALRRAVRQDRRPGVALPRGDRGLVAVVWKFLAPQRERFAAVVEGRAQRASSKFEEMRSKEDQD